MANKFNKKAPSSAKQVTKAKPKRKTSTRSAGAKTTTKKKNTVKRNALHRLGGEYATKPTQKKTTKKAPSKKKTTKAKPKAKAKATSKAGQSKRVEKPPGGAASRRNKKTGWANTRKFPHKNHPAYFRKKDKDDIEYVTFTHSITVDLEDEKQVPTRELNKNIDYKSKGDERLSRVVYRVYEGTRSSLGMKTNKYKLDKLDVPIVDGVFKNAPRRRPP